MLLPTGFPPSAFAPSNFLYIQVGVPGVVVAEVEATLVELGVGQSFPLLRS